MTLLREVTRLHRFVADYAAEFFECRCEGLNAPNLHFMVVRKGVEFPIEG